MEISETKQKRSASVNDGKRKLSDAIQHENVEGIREALLFLSTTVLAWEVKEESVDGCEIRRKHIRINVNFDVRVPNNHFVINDPSSIDSDCTNMQIHWTTKTLHAAIGSNPVNTEMIRCLLNSHTLRSEGENSEIILTTNAKDKLLEESHEFFNTNDGERRPGTTPLAMACRCRNLNLVKLLLEHGANPNINTTRRPGSTPLALACQSGDLSLSKLLLEYGADPNACGNDGLTPLIRSSRVGNLEMVQLLLLPYEDSDDETSDDDHESNDIDAPSRPHFSLSHSNSNINHPTLKRNNSSFHKNRWGTNVYHYDQQSMNALMHACAENHESIVRFLIQGNNNNNKNNIASIAHFVNHYRVDPALWYASAHGSANIVRFLMDECRATASYRKDPTVYSSTPLEEASQWGHDSTVKVLLGRSGSDPRAKSGQKARTQAERSGHVKVVQLLDVWKERMNTIENSSFPLGLLPLLLSRKADSAHRILCNHADGLICCQYRQRRRGNNKISSS